MSRLNSTPLLVCLLSLLCFPVFAEQCELSRPVHFSQQSEDNLIIVVLKVGPLPVSPDFELYQIDDQILVPVNALNDLLELDLRAEQIDLILRGKHLESGCEFNWSLKNTEDSYNETSWLWYQDDYDLYLDVRAINWIISSTHKYDPTLLHLIFTTEQQLPGLLKVPEQSVTEILRNTIQVPDRVFTDKYDALTWPVVNYNLSHDYQSANSLSRYNAQINSYFDIAHHSGEFRFNRSSGRNRSYFKLSHHIDQYDEDITDNYQIESQLDIMKYEVGDIQLQASPLIHNAAQGLGFHFFNREQASNQAFSRIVIEETTLPGWRAELFRNGEYIGDADAGDDNRVVFEDVETYYGSNRFEIVMYGNEGEQKTVVKSIQVGGNLLPEGALSYDISVQNPALSLFNDKQTISDNLPPNIRSQFSYGLTDTLTLDAGLHLLDIETTNDNDTALNTAEPVLFASTGLYYQLEHSSLNMSFVSDDTGNTGLFAGYSGVFDNLTRLNTSITHYDNLITSKHTINDNTKTTFNLSASGATPWLDRTRWSGGATSRLNKQDEIDTNFRLSLSTSLDRGTITNSLNHNDKEDFKFTRHSLFTSYRFEQIQISNTIDWEPMNGQKLRSVRSNIRWPQYRKMFNQTRLQYTPEQQTEFRLSHTTTWRQPWFNIQMGMTVDSEGEWQIRTGITGTLGMDYENNQILFNPPGSFNTGSIEAFSYIDDNADGVFDATDTPLMGTGYRGNSRWKDIRSGENGFALLPSVANGQRMNLDLVTVPDPFLKPAYENILVFTHRGGMQRVDIPMHPVNDIEGSTFLEHSAGSRPLARLPLVLKNKQGEVVEQLESESDGYFVFHQIQPGHYSLDTQPDFLSEREYRALNLPIQIDASVKGDSIIIDDILIAHHSYGQRPTEQKPASINEHLFYIIGQYQTLYEISKQATQPDFRHHEVRIYRDHHQGQYLLMVDSKQSQPPAWLLKLNPTPDSVSEDQLTTSDLRLFTQLINIDDRLSTGKQAIQQSTDDEYFCQLASYTSLASLSQARYDNTQLMLVERQLTSGTYYSLLTGPYQRDGLNQCHQIGLLNLTPEVPTMRAASLLKSEITSD